MRVTQLELPTVGGCRLGCVCVCVCVCVCRLGVGWKGETHFNGSNISANTLPVTSMLRFEVGVCAEGKNRHVARERECVYMPVHIECGFTRTDYTCLHVCKDCWVLICYSLPGRTFQTLLLLTLESRSLDSIARNMPKPVRDFSVALRCSGSD